MGPSGHDGGAYNEVRALRTRQREAQEDGCLGRRGVLFPQPGQTKTTARMRGGNGVHVCLSGEKQLAHNSQGCLRAAWGVGLLQLIPNSGEVNRLFRLGPGLHPCGVWIGRSKAQESES